MDDLVNLMRLIDLNSEIISEGHYLEMCNSIKNVHETISQLNSKYDSESESDDDTQNFYTLERRNGSNTILEPFTPPIPFLAERSRYYEDDNNEENTLFANPEEREELMNYMNSIMPYNSYTEMTNELRTLEVEQNEYNISYMKRLDERIVRIQRTINKTKTRQRITATVRKEAVKRRAQELGIRLSRYTLGNLLDKGHNVGNEREFYKAYLDDYNQETVNKLRGLNTELLQIIGEREIIRLEINEFH